MEEEYCLSPTTSQRGSRRGLRRHFVSYEYCKNVRCKFAMRINQNEIN